MLMILIVEDAPTIRSLITAMLKREPLIIDTAQDGLEALDNLRESASVVVLGLMMPRMNGADFLTTCPPSRPRRRSFSSSPRSSSLPP